MSGLLLSQDQRALVARPHVNLNSAHIHYRWQHVINHWNAREFEKDMALRLPLSVYSENGLSEIRFYSISRHIDHQGLVEGSFECGYRGGESKILNHRR